MSWKQLSDANKKIICSKCAYCSMELLDELIEEYNLYYYDEDFQKIPLLKNLEKAIPEQIFDHALLMKTIYGETYLFSNPYYDDEDITKVLSKYLGSEVFKVLGKDRSYYSPNSTNLFVIDLRYFLK